MTQAFSLERPLSEVIIIAKDRISTFKGKLATTTAQPPDPIIQQVVQATSESLPGVEAELIRILGLDLAGDFRPFKVPRWNGGYDVSFGYKLTACTAAGDESDVLGILSGTIRPALITLRDRINDTIDRIPITRANAKS